MCVPPAPVCACPIFLAACALCASSPLFFAFLWWFCAFLRSCDDGRPHPSHPRLLHLARSARLHPCRHRPLCSPYLYISPPSTRCPRALTQLSFFSLYLFPWKAVCVFCLACVCFCVCICVTLPLSTPWTAALFKRWAVDQCVSSPRLLLTVICPPTHLSTLRIRDAIHKFCPERACVSVRACLRHLLPSHR